MSHDAAAGGAVVGGSDVSRPTQRLLIDTACNLHISTAAAAAYQGLAAVGARAYHLPAAAAVDEAGEEADEEQLTADWC